MRPEEITARDVALQFHMNCPVGELERMIEVYAEHKAFFRNQNLIEENALLHGALADALKAIEEANSLVKEVKLITFADK